MNEFIDIDESLRDAYNEAVSHPMQSYEWGEFRKATGIHVIRRAQKSGEKLINAFTLTLHKVPKLNYTIGYLPKTTTPSQELLDELKRISTQSNTVYIQLEPNITKDTADSEWKTIADTNQLRPSFHLLFTKYTFILDLNKTEEDLLKEMHSKTRYNIRVAQRHGVEVTEDNSNEAFKRYLELTHETTTRQKFYAHTPTYHKTQWEILPHSNKKPYTHLSSHLLTASLNGTILTTWILFVFKNTLYYPYGASSNLHRNTMHSNLMMWEAIKFGKKLGLSDFDMWGALEQNPNPQDPWYGFHRFKEGYGPVHTEFIGSYDLVINPILYSTLKVADTFRWMLLRLKR